MEDLVHKPLEGLCRIPQTKWHLNELEEAKWSCDGSFVDICRINWDLVVGTH